MNSPTSIKSSHNLDELEWRTHQDWCAGLELLKEFDIETHDTIHGKVNTTQVFDITMHTFLPCDYNPLPQEDNPPWSRLDWKKEHEHGHVSLTEKSYPPARFCKPDIVILENHANSPYSGRSAISSLQSSPSASYLDLPTLSGIAIGDATYFDTSPTNFDHQSSSSSDINRNKEEQNHILINSETFDRDGCSGSSSKVTVGTDTETPDHSCKSVPHYISGATMHNGHQQKENKWNEGIHQYNLDDCCYGSREGNDDDLLLIPMATAGHCGSRPRSLSASTLRPFEKEAYTPYSSFSMTAIATPDVATSSSSNYMSLAYSQYFGIGKGDGGNERHVSDSVGRGIYIPLNTTDGAGAGAGADAKSDAKAAGAETDIETYLYRVSSMDPSVPTDAKEFIACSRSCSTVDIRLDPDPSRDRFLGMNRAGCAASATAAGRARSASELSGTATLPVSSALRNSFYHQYERHQSHHQSHQQYDHSHHQCPGSAKSDIFTMKSDGLTRSMSANDDFSMGSSGSSGSSFNDDGRGRGGGGDISCVGSGKKGAHQAGRDKERRGLRQQAANIMKGFRRKASEKARSILMDWIKVHEEHPYPTRAEKEELAAHTGMSVAQVVHWMSNVRKRRILPLLSGKKPPSSNVDRKFLAEMQARRNAVKAKSSSAAVKDSAAPSSKSV